MNIDKHYAKQAAQHQASIDRADAREDWLVEQAYDAMASATNDDLIEIMSGLDKVAHDSIMRTLLVRDPLFRMAAHQYFYEKLEKKHDRN